MASHTKVLSFPPVIKKFTFANPSGSCILHSMMKKQCIRSQIVESILEHAENQGITMAERELMDYSIHSLIILLSELQYKAIYNTPIPKKYRSGLVKY